MPTTQGFCHIHLFVRDIGRSVRFYRQAFGMREAFRDGPKLVSLNTPGTHDLVTLNEQPDAQDIGKSGGVWHFGFLVDPDSLEDILGAVEASGGRIIERGSRGPRSPFAAVHDPDGYTIELYTPET